LSAARAKSQDLRAAIVVGPTVLALIAAKLRAAIPVVASLSFPISGDAAAAWSRARSLAHSSRYLREYPISLIITLAPFVW
jgi:hypothetical protein